MENTVQEQRPLRVFTIYEDEWLYGTGSGFLCDHQNRCCVVGQICLAIGYTKQELRGHKTVGSLDDRDRFDDILGPCSDLLSPLMKINDNSYLDVEAARYPISKFEVYDASFSMKQRKNALQEAARRLGWQFDFQPTRPKQGGVK